MEADCNFSFHWIGRKWTLHHYIVRFVFVLNPHQCEQSEPLKSELLGFFPGSHWLSAQIESTTHSSCFLSHWFIYFPSQRFSYDQVKWPFQLCSHYQVKITC